jgi:hypothetical protein
LALARSLSVGDTPPPLQALRTRLTASRAGELVLRLYREHRRPTA